MINIKAFAIGFALLAPLAVLGPASAAKPIEPTGTLSYSGSTTVGGTVTLEATFKDVRKPDRVRLALICQTANTSVVYGEAFDLTSSPDSRDFTIGAGEYCRGDLYTVGPGSYNVKYLATVKFDLV
jgi:hypothetical protein